jgi:signal transduction histidine kinase
LLREVSQASGCESVGLRLHDRRDDFPYFAYEGFDDSFLERENSLCCCDHCGDLSREDSGLSVLECMCGRVLRNVTDTELPFFTPAGSFWTNAASELVASGAIGPDEVRGTCVSSGYESIALVPLRAGECAVGLLQLNSRGKGRFSAELLEFLEKIAAHAGRAVEAVWRREELALLLKEFESEQRGTRAAVAIDEMASILAHEVKNPLAGMVLSAGRLRKAVRGQKGAEEIAEHLIQSVNTLSETVTRVTRSAGRAHVEHRAVDVNEVLESALSLISPWAGEQGVVLVRRKADALPPVSGDAHHLKSAVLNLFINALEAMPDGGKLSALTSESDGHVEMIVTDTGPGVDPEEADSLFKPFVTGKENGTGLGLAIVRRIAEMHGGTALLRPGERGGTEAVLSLPPAGRRAGANVLLGTEA